MDGYLDVMLVRDLKRRQILPVLPKLIRGGHVGHPYVEFLRCKEVSFSFAEETPMSADGEVFAKRAFTARVLPGAPLALGAPVTDFGKERTMEQAGRIPPMMELAPLARAFTRAESPLYFVGGSVRNALLGLPYDDLDVTGAASSQQAVDLARSAGGKASIRDTEMGTVDIAVGELALEYTPFRRESYGPGGGHRPQQVIFTHRMEEDALRRDFTVNALYADVLTGEVADPLGGLADLNARRLRSCQAPMETLGDDGARILRMVRFACQLGFSVDPALYGAAKAMVGNLGDVAMERKRDELLKILLSDVRYPGLEKEFAAPGHLRGLLMLEDLGAFYDLLPQLMEGRGMEQPGRVPQVRGASAQPYGVRRHAARPGPSAGGIAP